MSCFARWTLLLALLLTPVAARAGDLKVYFFDIGQGDSALIISPTGKTVLIDAGPPEGGSHLKERLSALLTAPIDLVILTHPHLDHYGGMIKAISAHGAKLFMDSGFEHPAKTYDALLSYLQQQNIPVKDADVGRKIDLGGGAVLTILSGGKPYLTGTRSDPNANSVVTRLTYGKRAFYFSGDSEDETEKGILARGGDLSSDVYKVAHHGSRHSSSMELLRALHPSIGVISVAKVNDYGHPTKEAMDRLTQMNVKFYRTDQDGEIVITSDGTSLNVSKNGEPPILSAPAAPSVHDDEQPLPKVEVLPELDKPAPHGKPAPATDAAPVGGFVASSRGKVFHKASCPGAQSIKAENLTHFPTRDAAIAAGKTPAKDCKP